jgi:hypothetical protein
VRMARAGLRSLPRNVTDVTRVLLRLDGAVRNDVVSAEVASLPTEDALPIRQFYAWPGQAQLRGSLVVEHQPRACGVRVAPGTGVPAGGRCDC